MGPIGSILRVMTHPFTYSGRARFSEYWWFAGLTYLAYFAFGIWLHVTFSSSGALETMSAEGPKFEAWLEGQPSEEEVIEWLEATIGSGPGIGLVIAYAILSFWHYLAWCAVGARRLHDTGRGAGLYLLIHLWSYIFFIGLGIAIGVSAAGGGAEGVVAFMGLFSVVSILTIPLSIIFLVASIWYFICMFFPGDPGANKFGLPPGQTGGATSKAVDWTPPETIQAPTMSAGDLRALRQSRMDG